MKKYPGAKTSLNVGYEDITSSLHRGVSKNYSDNFVHVMVQLNVNIETRDPGVGWLDPEFRG